jgi:hypothetical protein
VDGVVLLLGYFFVRMFAPFFVQAVRMSVPLHVHRDCLRLAPARPTVRMDTHGVGCPLQE